MNVEKIMETEVEVCTPEMSIRDCANLMLSADCGQIPVVASQESRKLVGLITDRDIVCRVVAQGIDSKEAKVEKYMTKKACTVKPQDTLECALKIMGEKQVRRLPVVDEDMNCIGIVSQSDISTYGEKEETGELVRKISQPTAQGRPTQNIQTH